MLMPGMAVGRGQLPIWVQRTGEASVERVPETGPRPGAQLSETGQGLQEPPGHPGGVPGPSLHPTPAGPSQHPSGWALPEASDPEPLHPPSAPSTMAHAADVHIGKLHSHKTQRPGSAYSCQEQALTTQGAGQHPAPRERGRHGGCPVLRPLPLPLPLGFPGTYKARLPTWQ